MGFEYFSEYFYVDGLLAVGLDGLDEGERPIEGHFLEAILAREEGEDELFRTLEGLVFAETAQVVLSFLH